MRYPINPNAMRDPSPMRGLGVGVTSVPAMPLDPCQEQAADAVEGQIRVTSWPYYSRVKFLATRSGASGSFAYTLQLGTDGIRAFSYGVRQAKTQGGFTAADGNATIADTNLTNANETIGGQNVAISGIACQWMPLSTNGGTGIGGLVPALRPLDYIFLAALNSVISVELGLNGDENNYRLGVIPMVPGAGGLMGGADEVAGLMALDAPKNDPFATNGWPTRSNFFHVPEGLIWRNKGDADSQLNVIFRQQQTVVQPAGGSPENQALATTQAAVAGQSRGYNYPTEVSAELMVFLIGSVLGPRTRSA